MAQLPPFQVGKKRKPSLVAFAFLGALAQSCRGCGNRPARREPPLSREAFCGSKLKEGTLPKKKKKKTHTQTHTHRHKKQAQKEPNCTAPDTPSWSPYWSQLSLIGIEGCPLRAIGGPLTSWFKHIYQVFCCNSLLPTRRVATS